MNTRPLSNAIAEQSLLGGILSFEGYEEAYASITPEDFAIPQHREIFRAVLTLVQSGSPTDVTTVANLLHSTGRLEDAGGVPYLSGLCDGAALTLPSAIGHAEALQRVARLRRVHEAARAILRDVEDPEVAEGDVVSSAAQRLMDAAADGGATRMVSLGEATEEAWADLLASDAAPGGVVGAVTGMPFVDRCTGGLKGGELIIIGARPSVGKTGWAIQACLAMGHKGQGSALVSLEMPTRKILRRMWAHEANVDLRRPRDPAESRRLNDAVLRVRDMPIRVLDVTRSIGVVELRAKIQAAHRARPLAAVIVDYLGLMQHPKADRQDLRIAETTRQLKIMAREFDIAIVALHQLSRENEKQNRAPVLSDLRDSGAIEQDADVVIFLHVPNRDDERQMQWIVAKNREGPTGATDVTADRDTGRFYGVAR